MQAATGTYAYSQSYACLSVCLSACPPLTHCYVLLCCRHQIPRIDINAPSNAIELDPNVSALYGEGVADSSDECEEGSVGEEEVRNEVM